MVFIIWIMGICVFPFLLEWFLYATPVVSRFGNDTWFSFMGSYIGASVTLWVMYMTFKRSEEENKKILKKQKELHEIEMQRESICKIMHVLLLDGYYFLNPDTVSENLDRFIADFTFIQLDTLKYRYISLKDEALVDELLKLQKEEVEILNELNENKPHVDSVEKVKEFKEYLINTGLKLSKTANLKRQTIKIMYDSYIEKIYRKYYEE